MKSTHLGRIRHLAALLLASALTTGFASSANAAVLAYDGFDYTAGATLLGLNGGTGNWTSPWNDAQAAIGADVVQAGSLSFTDSMGNDLQTTGGKLLNTGSGGTSQGGRSITRINSGTTWITFLAQRAGETDGDPTNGLYPRGANLATFDLSAPTGVTQEKLNIGPKNSNSYWNDPNAGTQVDYVQFRYPSVPGALLETNLPNLATNRPTPNIGTAATGGNFNGQARDAFADELVQNVNFYVIRIDHHGDEMTADDIRVWINPRLDQTPSNDAVSFAYVAADLQAAADFQLLSPDPLQTCGPGGTIACSPYSTGNFGDQAFNRIRMFAGNVAGGGATPFAEILFDELRVATTFQDAAPIAAPAGTIGDYNGDLKVDAADYTVWRNNLGGAGSTLQNRDPANGSGAVSPADYTSWKSHFGQPPGAGSVSALGVPEPSAILLASLSLLAASAIRRRND